LGAGASQLASTSTAGWRDMRSKRRFSIVLKRKSPARLSISVFLILFLFFLVGCTAVPGQPTEAVHFRLPFIPVTFSLDSHGHFSVSVGLSITTPIGTFSASTEVGTPIPNNSTRVSIIHTVGGAPVKDVYDIAESGPMNVCLDGRFSESIGENNISIQPLDGVSTVSIVQAGSQCNTATTAPVASLKTSTPASQTLPAIAGIWTGTYTCVQGLTDLRLTINRSGGDAVTAIFDFSADPSNPGTPSGSFAMTGTYSANGLVLNQDYWINQPDGYSMVNLVAPPPTGNTIQGTVQADSPGCTSFSVSR
jgi:hypothetical protein